MDKPQRARSLTSYFNTENLGGPPPGGRGSFGPRTAANTRADRFWRWVLGFGMAVLLLGWMISFISLGGGLAFLKPPPLCSFNPLVVAAGSRGHIYIGDSVYGRIERYSAGGRYETSWPVDAGGGIFRIALDGVGTIQIACARDGLLTYTTRGRLLSHAHDPNAYSRFNPGRHAGPYALRGWLFPYVINEHTGRVVIPTPWPQQILAWPFPVMAWAMAAWGIGAFAQWQLRPRGAKSTPNNLPMRQRVYAPVYPTVPVALWFIGTVAVELAVAFFAPGAWSEVGWSMFASYLPALVLGVVLGRAGRWCSRRWLVGVGILLVLGLAGCRVLDLWLLPSRAWWLMHGTDNKVCLYFFWMFFPALLFLLLVASAFAEYTCIAPKDLMGTIEMVLRDAGSLAVSWEAPEPLDKGGVVRFFCRDELAVVTVDCRLARWDRQTVIISVRALPASATSGTRTPSHLRGRATLRDRVARALEQNGAKYFWKRPKMHGRAVGGGLAI